jgi:hypothetical protein
MSVPYSIAAMKTPAKFAFSAKCSEDVIFGALGLLDQGTPLSTIADIDKYCSREYREGRDRAGGEEIDWRPLNVHQRCQL